MEIMEMEKYLKRIKDAELDIELLVRENEKLCAENNSEIENLKSDIALAEMNLKVMLKESEKDKLECKLGSVIFKQMPDEWKYQDEILMAWIISLPTRLKNLFLKVTTTINKAELKKQIMIDNEILFENSKLVDEDTKNIELFLFEPGFGEEVVVTKRNYKVEGIEIKHAERKFSYNIKTLKK